MECGETKVQMLGQNYGHRPNKDQNQIVAQKCPLHGHNRLHQQPQSMGILLGPSRRITQAPWSYSFH
ncbi:MAG: hypothetical protein RL595_572 [Planctomycetota bacterium]